MRVVTWDENNLQEGCRQLEALAREFQPDLIVAIANGGTLIAQSMFSSLPHCIIKCQRKSTSKKSGHSLIWTIIRKLPLRIKNLMRIAEAKFLKNRPQSSEVYIDSYALNMLAVSKRVLIVDDAVDSGTTLSSVIASINKLEGERMIKSAVITITTSDPKIMPEYSLFNNETLIRFPWAKDN